LRTPSKAASILELKLIAEFACTTGFSHAGFAAATATSFAHPKKINQETKKDTIWVLRVSLFLLMQNPCGAGTTKLF